MTRKISTKTTLRLLDTVAFMNAHHGVAPNGMITLNFEQLGLTSGAQAKQALTKMNEALAGKIRRYGEKWGYELPHYYFYVHEDVPSSHGHHVHELLVVPRGLSADLNGWLKGWAKRNYGTGVPDEAIDYRGKYPKDLAGRVKQQANLLRYVLKSSADGTVADLDGTPTTLHSVLETERYARSYCARVQRVAGTSQNISLREQLWMGFEPPSSPASVLAGKHLAAWEADRNLDELLEMLRKIDC